MTELYVLWQALILGILQGLTEFLPVSSSAHLILLPWMLRWNNPLIDSLLFDVALHAGTLVAILWYFRADWVNLLKGFFRILIHRKIDQPPDRLVLYIILASVPAALVGLLLEKWVEASFRNPALIVIPLILVSLLMILVERRARQVHTLPHISLKDSFLIGIAQALALLPGVSRSGITITTGLFLGYQREAATRFSFLLSTPAIGGAVLLQSRHLLQSGIGPEWPVFAIGLFSSTLVGYVAIAFLMRYLRDHTLNIFAGYRLILSALVISIILGRG